LHVFEPRYRRLTADALDSHGLIAIAMFDGEVDQSEYFDGQPPLRPNVCIGYIERYEPLEGGRYLIMLRGLCRARIHEEISADTPYRQAILEPTEYPPADNESLQAEADQLRLALSDPVLEQVDDLEPMRELFTKPVPTVGIIDLTIATITEDPEARYRMLSEPDAAARAEWLLERLEAMRASAAPTDGPDWQ
jgi:Lon protease-like protein